MRDWLSLSRPAHPMLIGLVVVLLLVHGFWPEVFAVDVFTLGLLGILVILALRPYLKSAKLPGGAGMEFRDELQAGEETHQQVEARIEEEASATPDASERIREVHALFVIPDYLRDLVKRDPNLALAGLRMELEQSLRLASKVLQGGRGQMGQLPLSRVVDELAELGHLDADQAELARSIIRIGNRAVHAELVSVADAELVFEWADTLNRSFAVGYSLNFAPNLDFEAQGLICEYEHCIEHMPLGEPSEDSCPVFGHDCPGGRRRIVTCPPAQAMLAGYMPVPPERFVGHGESNAGEA